MQINRVNNVVVNKKKHGNCLLLHRLAYSSQSTSSGRSINKAVLPNMHRCNYQNEIIYDLGPDLHDCHASLFFVDHSESELEQHCH